MALALAGILSMALPALAGAAELLILGGSPFPFSDSNGGLYGEKKGGWEAGVGYDLHLRDTLSLRFEASYLQLPNAVTFDGLSPMKVTHASVNAKIITCDKHKIQPYFLMGLGIAQVNVMVDRGSTELTYGSTEFVGRLGGGFDYNVNGRWGLFAEAFVFQSDYLSLIPVRAGLRLKL